MVRRGVRRGTNDITAQKSAAQCGEVRNTNYKGVGRTEQAKVGGLGRYGTELETKR